MPELPNATSIRFAPSTVADRPAHLPPSSAMPWLTAPAAQRAHNACAKISRTTDDDYAHPKFAHFHPIGRTPGILFMRRSAMSPSLDFQCAMHK
jgi:hypothetical protein